MVSGNASIPYLPNSRPTPEYFAVGRLDNVQDFAAVGFHILEVEPAAQCVNYKRLHLWLPWQLPPRLAVFPEPVWPLVFPPAFHSANLTKVIQ